MIKYTDDIKKMNLHEKISQISSEIEYLQKDDKVGYGNNSYKAISIEKVVTTVADKMCKYGVVIYPVQQSYKRKDEEVVKKDGTGGVNRISDVDVIYEVVNIHNPQERLVTVSSGTGVDTQDKGIGKAMTYSYKNMLIRLFAIPTGDDTDKVHSDDYTNKLMGESKNTNTDDKEKKLYEMASKKGFTPAQVVARCKAKYSKTLIKMLTDEEYKETWNALEGAK